MPGFDQPLPIDDVLRDTAMELDSANRLVLAAPPGAGKTTRVPLALLDHAICGAGRVVKLEPRRIEGPLDADRLAALLGDLEPDAVTLLSFLNDPEQTKFLTVGESVFQTNCASCHKSDGAGISGPNMTDDHYLHVKRIADIPNVVMKGANGGALPAWGIRLSKIDIVLVSAYVASLRGQHLTGRTAEGDELAATWDELEAPAAAATQP